MIGSEKIAVIGLGYVGLPVALAFAKKFKGTVGFDINEAKVRQLRDGIDATGEVAGEEIRGSSILFSADPKDLAGCTFFVVAVPTPVDQSKRPDLTPVIKASETVGRALRPGAVVVYESTVYPGVTEEICGPILARVSGLKASVDFKLGYSPERINPGDKKHTLERIVKVVSGEDEATLKRVADTYGRIIEAGVYRAKSIKVAEAAKVIENTQRDINIALMNELSLIFDRVGIRTRDVLDAAETKWNFLPFRPGLVGGHCIGVDPYYLTMKAEELGYHPQVILAGRRINDGMGVYIAQKCMQLLMKSGIETGQARIGIFGLTFKENVPDIRNSRVPDIIKELREYGVEPLVADPLADSHEVQEEYGLKLTPSSGMRDLDAAILAVPHDKYVQNLDQEVLPSLRTKCVFVDVKSVVSEKRLGSQVRYWAL